MMIFPFALVLMYGRMLGRMRHAFVIFSVMLLLMAGTIVWSVYYDTLKPNPGLTGHPVARTYRNPQRDGAGRETGGDSARRSGLARGPAPGQSRRQGDALRDLGRRHL